MIRNIFNWVGGGFFRTIGRYVAFIVLGAIAYIFIVKSNIKITDLLGIEMVKASENNLVYNITNAQWSTVYNSGYSNMALGDDRLWTANGNFNSNQRFYMKTNVINIPNSTEYIQVNIKFRPNNAKTFTCTTNWSLNQVVNDQTNGFMQMEYLYTGFGCTENNYEWGLTLTYAYNSSMDQSPCYAVTNVGDVYTFQCPVPNTLNNVYGFVLRAHANTATTFQGGIDQKIAVKLDSTSQIIENQNHNTNQTISAITDTNMTETNSTANSFFDNFTDTDHGGLSSIITAPISTINSMLSNTCVAPSAIWKGATITLPCGDMLWSRPGAQDLQNLLNVFYGGFICYYAIRRLFFLIENLKDPTKDNLEVTDL